MLTPVQIYNTWWTDGGLRDVTPLQIAIESIHADEIDVVLAQDKFALSNIKKPRVLQDAPRVLEIMTNEIIENDLKMAQLYNKALEKGALLPNRRSVKINVIRPQGKLTYNSLKFEQDFIRPSIIQGYRDAHKLFSK